MKFSEKLQKLRKEKGLSQEQLADMLEVSRQSVSKWESGTTYPEMDKLLMLCKIFNITLDDLTNDAVTDKNIKEKRKGTLNNVIYAVLDTINKSVEMFKNMDKKDLKHCITEMLIVIFLLWLCSIPFSYVNNLADDIFINFGNKAHLILCSIWHFLTSIIYFVLFVTVLFYIYKIRYLDKFDETKINNIDEKSNKEEIKEEKVVSKNKEKDGHSFVIFSFLSSIFNFVVKMCLLFISIPIVCVFFSFVFLIVAAIILLCKGIVYPGILIALLGCVILSGIIMELAVRFLLSIEISFQRLFFLFIGGLITCSIGVAITTFEIAETDYINTVPVSEKMSAKSFTFDMTPDLQLGFNHSYYYYYSNVNYITDETVIDEVIITINYYDKYTSVNTELNDNLINIYTWEAPNIFKNSYTLLIENLKDKVLYNYSDLYEIEINVTTSSNNIKTLKDNYKKYIEEKENHENMYNYYDDLIRENNELKNKNQYLERELENTIETIEELQDKINEIENLVK